MAIYDYPEGLVASHVIEHCLLPLKPGTVFKCSQFGTNTVMDSFQIHLRLE